jgi:hypothetical protein
LLFGDFFIAFTDAYDMKMAVSRYHSIDMHYIVLSVKFDGRLSISLLKKVTLYKKKGIKKFIFQANGKDNPRITKNMGNPSPLI